jgi:hypothetical protein
MRLPDNHELRKVKVRSVRGCPESILNVFEQDIYAASKAAASRNDTVPPGEMRMIETRDPQNGQRIISFYGQESFVKQMTIPGRRVTRFRAPVDYSGRPMAAMNGNGWIG